MEKSLVQGIVAALIVFLVGLVFILGMKVVQFEAKLQAIEAIAYSNSFEQPALWPVLDICDNKLGEE